jgi:hypothetical protein
MVAQAILVVILLLKVTLEARATQTAQPIQQVVEAVALLLLERKLLLIQEELVEQVLLLILHGFPQ